MKLTELLAPWIPILLPDVTITSLENDSRVVRPGALFFAYPGALADGRLFMEQAIARGAAAIVYEPAGCPISLPKTCPVVPLENLSRVLGAIASRFYGSPSKKLSVTGVTGTNGKTTIAHQLAEAYGLLGQRSAYIGTLGQGEVGALQALSNTTPDALALQRYLYEFHQRGIKQVCMEVSSHALCQGRVDKIDFYSAIYTNLSHEHLDFHQTMDAYAEAKSTLFATPSLKCAIINQDDAYRLRMLEKISTTTRPITYGLHNPCDVRAMRWQISLTGTTLSVSSPWGSYDLAVKVLGTFNVYNTLAVFSSLLASEVAPADALAVMFQLHASPGRMEVVSKSPCVIVDYAHTPDALENVLTTLTQLKQGRLAVVMGCGGDRDRAKRPMMGRIASQYADLVMITNDNPRTEDPAVIAKEIQQGLKPGVVARVQLDRAKAIEEALHSMGPTDILLIAGKGHEAYQLIGKERFDFSDQAVVRELVG